MSKEGYHLYDGKVIKILSCSECNVKCKHCYISFKGSLSGCDLYDMVNKLADDHEIRINGSEPLLHKEYLESLKRAKQKLILTNGLVFKDNYDYIDELKDIGIKRIGISYHFDIHDSISLVSKEYLDNLFKEIIKRGLDVQVMTTITSENYKMIPEYCDYCFKNGIKIIRFTNFISQGNAKEMDDNLILSDEERNDFFRIIDDMRSIYPKDILEIQRCGSFGNDINGCKEFCCDAGFGSVVITPDYSVYPCLFFAKKGNEIGYYEDGNIYISDDYKNDRTECMAIKKLNKRMCD